MRDFELDEFNGDDTVNETFNNAARIMNNTTEDVSVGTNTMEIVHSVIASVGIITNLIVVVVMLNDRKLRRKIPNICVINLVSSLPCEVLNI